MIKKTYCGLICSDACFPDVICSEDGVQCANCRDKLRYDSEQSPEWAKAVLDQLVVAGILRAEHYEHPRMALEDLISWCVDLALDPSVSSRARALIERGKAEPKEKRMTLEEYLEHFPEEPVATCFVKGSVSSRGSEGSYYCANCNANIGEVWGGEKDTVPMQNEEGGHCGTCLTLRIVK